MLEISLPVLSLSDLSLPPYSTKVDILIKSVKPETNFQGGKNPITESIGLWDQPVDYFYLFIYFGMTWYKTRRFGYFERTKYDVLKIDWTQTL